MNVSPSVTDVVRALRAERRRREWTQDRVARAARVRQSDLCQWELGHTTPTLPSLAKWAGALGLPLFNPALLALLPDREGP